jgi:DNA-binding LacI/PurR family transcriptional regulator
MSALRVLEEEQLISRRHGSGVYWSEVNRQPVIAYCRPKSPATDLDLKENALQVASDARGWKFHVHRFDPAHVDIFAEEIRAHAFILQPEMVTFHSPLLSRLVQGGIPRVVLGRDTGGANLDFVTGDDEAILKELIKGVVDRGHRRLALLVSEPPFYEILERVKAFQQTCRLLDLDTPVILDVKAEYGSDSTVRSADFLKNYLAALPQKRLPFTALITCSNSGSIPALRMFHEAGFNVPADCSVCCMGSDSNAQYTIPSLTNAASHYAQLAESCLQILDKRLKKDGASLLFERILYRAIWRESTRAR